MARQKKMSDETLLDIIKDYLDNNTFVTKIKFLDLVKHGVKMGHENLIYHDFTRNKTVREFVDLFNEKHDVSNYFKVGDENTLNKIDFNVDPLIDKNHKDINKLKVILKVYKKNYDSAFKRIDVLEAENTTLVEKLKEQEDLVNNLKNKNNSLKAKIEDITEKRKLDDKATDKEFILNGIEFLLEMGNVTISDKEDLSDILKNLGYISDDDLFKDEDIHEEIQNVSSLKPNKENKVISINTHKNTIDLPDFMK